MIRQLIERAGYGVGLRQDGWFECLAVRGDERWLGRGLTEDEALADVLRQMAPSALARGLVAEALGAMPGPPAREATRATPPGAATPKVAAMPTPAPSEPAAPPREPTFAPPEGAAASSSDAGHVAPSAEAAPPAAASAPGPTIIEGPKLKRAPGPPPPLAPPRKIDEDLDELGVLEDRLKFMLPELSMMARDLQRMGFIAFIGRARHIAARANDARVEKVVTRLAGRLAELAQQLWPGSVKALQIKATPLNAGADLGLADGGKLHDWAEVAETAERLVEERRAALAADGLDDYGWADGKACEPAPNDADARLEQVRNSMEKFFGQLDKAQPSETDRELQQNPDKVLPDLLRWAREVRWLRPHVDDRLGWGRAMGRLRWAATRLPKEQREQLTPLLDETARPTKTWPLALGEDPVAKARKKQRSALLKRKPEVSATPEVIGDWLGEAFELGDSFTTAEIGERVVDLAPVILALPADEGSGRDRKYRRRLKLLQDDLTLRTTGAPAVGAAPEADDASPAPEAPLEPDEGDLAFQRLLAAVRERVRGKSALFVSNRADPMLKDRLERELEVAIEWAEIDPRRLQARVESVRRASYDIVLSATGFQGHSVDATLGRETRAMGLPYVRVNRGRLTTCVRAIARQFGLLDAA